jgi:GH15 family glucan-1,4-alpha-glucosidase
MKLGDFFFINLRFWKDDYLMFRVQFCVENEAVFTEGQAVTVRNFNWPSYGVLRTFKVIFLQNSCAVPNSSGNEHMAQVLVHSFSQIYWKTVLIKYGSHKATGPVHAISPVSTQKH